jgi:hypothetical protein
VISRHIQERLLPQATLDIEGYELSGMYRPSLEVAGDLYDWMPSGDAGILFTVADVEKGDDTIELAELLSEMDDTVDAAGMVARLIGTVPEPPSDDVTIVVLRRLSSSPSPESPALKADCVCEWLGDRTHTPVLLTSGLNV